jgi:hypothetical protein
MVPTLMDDDTSLLALTSRCRFNGILVIVTVLLGLDHALRRLSGVKRSFTMCTYICVKEIYAIDAPEAMYVGHVYRVLLETAQFNVVSTMLVPVAHSHTCPAENRKPRPRLPSKIQSRSLASPARSDALLAALSCNVL